MSEYISKEKAIARFEEIKKSGVSLKDSLYLDGVMAVLESMETAKGGNRQRNGSALKIASPNQVNM